MKQYSELAQPHSDKEGELWQSFYFHARKEGVILNVRSTGLSQ